MRLRPETKAPIGRGKVLIVDDITANRELLTQDLEDEGFEVNAVASGAACLVAAARDQPDVVLMDIHMAGMDGVETCRRLKADPVTQHIPVVFVTGSRADDATAISALAAGGNDFLTKPYSQPILVARVTCQVTIARAAARLRRHAMTDELTGVYSRRYLLETLRRTMKLTCRTAGSLACLLVDVDHFKAVNDRLGHLEGDRVLCEVASTMGTAVRGSDLVARYGGEEFVVLLPETDLDGAATVGEKIRAAVEKHCAPVTVSVGAAAFRVDEPHVVVDEASVERAITALLRDADHATYAAKLAGRNQVAKTAST